ncbi:adenosine deaminase [Nocardiopsis sinuspersici]|uniref:Adenosine deaminase n=1 Tax=Nocardiopsis sinuspersici TaxID=501010 RepID=A0A1V3C8B2_9ACTN|nr:adenosine deaminase [Nocardiopsis sinuspersici]
MDALLSALPKVDLHLHLLGAAEPEAVARLAARRRGHGVPTDADGVRRYFAFTGFAHFIEVYTSVNSLVTSAADVEDLVRGLGRRLAEHAVRYAEVTVTPLSHLRRGLRPEELAEALTLGRTLVAERHGVTLNWIFDASGDEGPEEASATVDWIVRHRPEGTVGFGLGGPEAVAPRALFRDAFARARDHGLHSVPHAGETTTAQEVRSAVLDLGAERVGHGIRAAGDPALLELLVERNVTLEVCPTSNLRTGAVSSLDVHPLPDLLGAGVPVVLGSDDPAMFGTDLEGEYRLCARRWGLSLSRILDLAEAGVRAAFCGEELRARMLDDVARLRDSLEGTPGVSRRPGAGRW